MQAEEFEIKIVPANEYDDALIAAVRTASAPTKNSWCPGWLSLRTRTSRVAHHSDGHDYVQFISDDEGDGNNPKKRALRDMASF